MADETDTSPSDGADLFTGIKFWLSHQVPMRSTYLKDLRNRGARIVTSEALADMRIIDDARKNPPVGEGIYHSYKFIEVSLKTNTLPDANNFVVGAKSAIDRPVGSSTITQKGKRNPFTMNDDQILVDWLEPYRHSGGRWKGNEIYKQLALKYPHHTFQSWRSRYLLMVSQGIKMSVTEQPDPSPEIEHQEDDASLQRSPKRRRIDPPPPAVHSSPQSPSKILAAPVDRITEETSEATGGALNVDSETRSHSPKATHVVVHIEETVSRSKVGGQEVDLRQVNTLTAQNTLSAEQSPEENAPSERSNQSENAEEDLDAWEDAVSESGSVDHTPRYYLRQALGANHTLETISRLNNFTIRHVRELYRAVPDIQQTDPEKLEKSWEEAAENWKAHTAAEWRYFYDTYVLPEYMRRNKLETTEDLNQHIHRLLAKEETLTTSKRVSNPKPSISSIVEEENHGGPEADVQQENPAGSVEILDPRSDESYPNIDPVDVQYNSIVDHESTSQSPHSSATKPEEGRKTDQPSDSQQSEPQSAITHSPKPTHSSQTSPKKRLFGRSLDPEALSSQEQPAITTANPTSSNAQSSESHAVGTNTGAIVNSQSMSSSRLPPESGQRPPKSVSTSQDSGPHFAEQIGQQLSGEIGAMTNKQRPLNAPIQTRSSPRGSSPTLDLLGDGNLPHDDMRSSPAPSDTGSEYVAFDDAPARSQLWDMSQDEFQENISDQHDEIEEDLLSEGDEEKPERNIKLNLDGAIRHQTPTPQSSEPEDSYVSEDKSESTNRTDASGSPELDIHVVPQANQALRTETQYLFQQPMPDIEDDTTIFDIPPPEGGWEQFSDLQEDVEEVRTSVEMIEGDANSDAYETSSSQTQEPPHESIELGEHIETIADDREVIAISDDGSDHTTFSNEEDLNVLVTTSMREPKRPPIDSISSKSDTTTYSDTASVPEVRQRPNVDSSSISEVEEDAIRSWFSDQSEVYKSLNQFIFSRLASTALQATVINLSAATFTLRDLVSSFQQSEAERKTDFERSMSLKQEDAEEDNALKFKPTATLTEEAARRLLPQNVLGVWTIDDDRDFLSQTRNGIERVERKHGSAGVRQRAKFLRARYGLGELEVSAISRSAPSSARRKSYR